MDNDGKFTIDQVDAVLKHKKIKANFAEDRVQKLKVYLDRCSSKNWHLVSHDVDMSERKAVIVFENTAGIVTVEYQIDTDSFGIFGAIGPEDL